MSERCVLFPRVDWAACEKERCVAKSNGVKIPLEEYSQRRERVRRGLDGALALVYAGESQPLLHGKWEADAHFQYLTGIADEAGAIVLLDPKAEDPKRREILFLAPLNPEMEAWDGYRDPVSAALKARTGFQTIMRTTALPRVLTDLARKRGSLACLHPFASINAAPSPDLTTFKKVLERTAGVSIVDRTNLLPGLRAVKSKAELELMKGAIAATAVGFEAAMRMLRPGVREADVQHAIEAGFREAGASGPAYNSIVGSGVSGTVLHYMANTGVAKDGELMVIDAGARFHGYAADITRTLPVSGKFTREQAVVYDVVLEAQRAAILTVKPGVRMHEVDAAAREVIEKAGYGDTYIHGIGHQLGLEVHDATPDGPLEPGMVVTIEPGVYIKDRGLGVRIEDDILVTRTGRENLSAMIPKTREEIEKAMKRRQGGGKGGR